MPRLFFEAVNRGDVGVIQRGEHFRFALKAREPIGVSRDGRRQSLDRNLALQLRVRRAVDLAHAAGADGGDHFIGTETRAGSEGQGWRDYIGERNRWRVRSYSTPQCLPIRLGDSGTLRAPSAPFVLPCRTEDTDYGVTGAHLRSTVPEENVWVSTGLSLTLF